MKIGLFNELDVDLSSELKIIKKVLKFGLKKLKINKVEFNVIIVDNDYIRKLNKDYRGINKETDVISFALEDDKTFNLKERILGDIYISYPKALKQAEEYQHSLRRELCFLAVHGLLHLLGYDHIEKKDEEIMFKLQGEILDETGIKQ